MKGNETETCHERGKGMKLSTCHERINEMKLSTCNEREKGMKLSTCHERGKEKMAGKVLYSRGIQGSKLINEPEKK